MKTIAGIFVVLILATSCVPYEKKVVAIEEIKFSHIHQGVGGDSRWSKGDSVFHMKITLPDGEVIFSETTYHFKKGDLVNAVWFSIL